MELISPKSKRQKAWAKLRPSKKLSFSGLSPDDEAGKLKRVQSLPVFRQTFSIEEPLVAVYGLGRSCDRSSSNDSGLGKKGFSKFRSSRPPPSKSLSFKDRLLSWLNFGNKKQQLMRRPSLMSRYSYTLEVEESEATTVVAVTAKAEERDDCSFLRNESDLLEEEDSHVIVSPENSSSSSPSSSSSSFLFKSQDELPKGVSEKLSNLSIRKIQDGNRNLHQLLMIHLILVKCTKMNSSLVSTPDSDEYRDILSENGEAGKEVREVVKVVSFSATGTSSSMLRGMYASPGLSTAGQASASTLRGQENINPLPLFGEFLSTNSNNYKTERGLSISYGASITVTTDFLPVIITEKPMDRMIADDMWDEVSRNVNMSITADVAGSGNLLEEDDEEGGSDRSSGDSGYISLLEGDEEVKTKTTAAAAPEEEEEEWNVENRILLLQENLLSIFDGF